MAVWRWAIFAWLLMQTPVRAHVSEQGLVLLLPTHLYIAGGVATVAVTFLLLGLTPDAVVERVFRPIGRFTRTSGKLPFATRAISSAGLLFLIMFGFLGPQDPLENFLPLTVWTVFWISLVSVQGVIFDIWRWINPFQLFLIRSRGFLRYPASWDRWPAFVLFIAFAGFLLADPAPADPSHLATVVAIYSVFTVVGILLFGFRWLVGAEFLTVLMRTYRGTAILSSRWGPPGWRLVRQGQPSMSVALFMLALLAVGSFDGLNETFWWLGVLEINPLEFPGRSAIIEETLIGLVVFLFGLIFVYTATIGLGHYLAVGSGRPSGAFCAFAPSLLPIAVGYHVAHYFTSFLVDIQYVALALSESLLNREFHVTTGFFNTVATVRFIWLTQAGAVVLGHVLAILVAHAIALRFYGTRRQAVISQIPLAALMVAYTLFGLWLLASPRGV